MSGSLDKLDKKKAQLKHQLDTARENGDENKIKTISALLNKNSSKRDNTIKYSKIARENPREDHKGKKKRRADETIVDEKEEYQEKKEEEALGDPRVAIYDELVARKDPAEPN